MLRMAQILIVVSLALAVLGCASRAKINEVMASWMGCHFSDLIESWGPPQQVLDDGYGGKIYVYATTRTHSSFGYATTQIDTSGSGYAPGYTTYNPPQVSSYTAYRMFWINPEGTIYRWSWRGY